MPTHIFAILGLLIGACCAASATSKRHEQRSPHSKYSAQALQLPGREDIWYHWQDVKDNGNLDATEVLFTHVVGSNDWNMTVDRTGSEFGGQSKSSSTLHEVLTVANGGLREFFHGHPKANLVSVNLSVASTTECWKWMINTIRDELSNTPGTSIVDHGDNGRAFPVYAPRGLDHRLREGIKRSMVLRQFISLLGHYGMRFRYTGYENLAFKTTLDGTKWSDIAKQRDAGVEDFGIIEFTKVGYHG